MEALHNVVEGAIGRGALVEVVVQGLTNKDKYIHAGQLMTIMWRKHTGKEYMCIEAFVISTFFPIRKHLK